MTSATSHDDPSASHASTVPPFSIADAAPQGDEAQRTLLPFPTVAIGASAGGVEALLRLFGLMPADSGCAFIAVMHLDPERESMMASLLGRATTMPVVQAEDDMPVAANHVYTNPPGHYLELCEGRLVLGDIPMRPPRSKAVDHFMISLAADQRERAIAVVLTGTDGDGALGVKAIKAEGGMTIAQTPASAAHSGMPQSAIDTGMVDSCLTIEDMPAAILDYVAHAHLQPAPGESAPDESDEKLFELLTELKDRSGLDFRGYKTPMLKRRVHRRMGLARIGDLGAYVEFLRATPDEASTLAGDFLISVTEFFREPDAWGVLAEEVLPRLLNAKSEGDNLRVWVPACATGEEAYSIAMLLMEHPRVAELRLKLQVFATDVDRRALDIARAGNYAATIEQAVSASRRRRFFSKSEGHYQVRKELRDAVLFAPHDLVNDPPFSHMDLVSCRNLLIYLEPELQRRLLQVFHFALDPGGCLFLGKSETVGSQAALFAPASQRSRIFRRVGPSRVAANLRLPAVSLRPRDAVVRPTGGAQREADYARLIREALLETSSSAGILANSQGQTLYFYGPVRAYVEQPEGSPTSDLYSVLRDELRPHVRALMHKAAAERHRAEATVGVPLEGEGEQPVRLVAAPVAGGDADLLLLSFERLARAPLPERTPLDDTAALHALEDELRTSKRELRAVIEELEAANEELKVANEETMSMNEELQSTNEELETSKEELQSVNEELSTVNNQLQLKVHELEGANNDLGNLLASTHMPTLFLDRRMCIKRFTPAATQLFSLLPGDLNRPLTDIASRCDMRALQRDAERVLSELAPLQEEERSDDGRFFLRRTLPYRTQEDRIEGVVVTFTDITELKRAAADLRRFEAVVRSSSDAIIVHDVAGKVLAWNRGAQALYGYTEAAALGTPMMMLLPPDARGVYEAQMRRALAGETVQGVAMRRRTREGRVIDVSATLSAVQGDDGTPNALALIERDITQQLRADADLRASEQRFRILADSAPALIWITDAEGRLSFTNRECTFATGQTADKLQGQRWTDLLHPDDLPHVQTATWRAGRDGTGGRIETTARLLPHNGEARWVKIVVLPRAEAGSPGLVGCMFDIDAQMGAEEALRLADRRKDEFLAMLGHELRNPLVPIRNAAEVLKKVGGNDARIAWVRDTLVRQVDHVTRLVDDLLDISRVTRGTMSLHLEPVELAGVIARAVDSARPLLERKRHRFDLREPDEPLWVEGDAIRLAQIFENLLTNAAKYTDEGGELSLKLTREGEEAVVHVRDNGMGIAPGMQGRMFDLFVQDQRSADRSQGGLGIGLALVRHLVDLHGGTVSGESAGAGKGSDFVVRLPLLPAAALPAPAEARPQDTSAGGRVLLLDDDVDGSESLAVLLRLSGFEVETAHDLDSGLRAAASFAPQVVMLDLAMPGADGYEIARRLRALPALAKTKYVVLSGFGAPEDLARSRLAGFAHHFVKPADPQEVQALLADLIAAQDAGGEKGS